MGRGASEQPPPLPDDPLNPGVWVPPSGGGVGEWGWHGSRPAEGVSGAREAGAARGGAGSRRGGEEKGAGGSREAGGLGGVEPGPQRPPLARRYSRRRRRSGLGSPGGRAGARRGSGACGCCSPPAPGAAARWVPAPGPAPLGPSRPRAQSRALPRRTLCAGRAAPGSRPRAMKRGL